MGQANLQPQFIMNVQAQPSSFVHVIPVIPSHRIPSINMRQAFPPPFIMSVQIAPNGFVPFYFWNNNFYTVSNARHYPRFTYQPMPANNLENCGPRLLQDCFKIADLDFGQPGSIDCKGFVDPNVLSPNNIPPFHQNNIDYFNPKNDLQNQ